MIILRNHAVQTKDLFEIERNIVKVSEKPYDYTLEYSLLNKPRSEVYGFIGGLLNRMNIAQTLGISTSDFLEFLMDIEKGYNDNPYHSFYHAVDVVMVLYHFLECYDISEYLTRIDVAILVIAALCHDIGHPGNNNQFETASHSKLDKEFSHLSVLESNSCKITLELIDKHDLIRHIETKSEEYEYPLSQSDFKCSLVKMILATDMKCHFHLLHNLQNLNNQHPSLKSLFDPAHDPLDYFQKYFTSISPHPRPPGQVDKDHTSLKLGHQASRFNSSERLMLCNILIHAADVSNPCRPWKVFSELSRLVCIEFFRQAQREKTLGLPPHLDHSNTSKINVGFIDFIVLPYFESLVTLFPKAAELLTTCVQNRDNYMKQAPDRLDLDSPVSIQLTLGRPALIVPPGTVEIPKSVELDVRRKRLQRSISYNPTLHAPVCFRRQSEELINNDFKKQKIA
ncbi:unnamed protein product [Rhizopus stolonifer]